MNRLKKSTCFEKPEPGKGGDSVIDGDGDSVLFSQRVGFLVDLLLELLLNSLWDDLWDDCEDHDDDDGDYENPLRVLITPPPPPLPGKYLGRTPRKLQFGPARCQKRPQRLLAEQAWRAALRPPARPFPSWKQKDPHVSSKKPLWAFSVLPGFYFWC